MRAAACDRRVRWSFSVLILVRSQNDDPSARTLRKTRPAGIDAAAIEKSHVHHDDVRPVATSLQDCVCESGRLSHHLKMSPSLATCRSTWRMVIGEIPHADGLVS
jgi:hypothetical protein